MRNHEDHTKHPARESMEPTTHLCLFFPEIIVPAWFRMSVVAAFECELAIGIPLYRINRTAPPMLINAPNIFVLPALLVMSAFSRLERVLTPITWKYYYLCSENEVNYSLLAALTLKVVLV